MRLFNLWLKEIGKLRWKLSSVLAIFLDLAALAISFLVFWIHEDVRFYAKQRSQFELAATVAKDLQPLYDQRASLSEVYQKADHISALNPDIALYMVAQSGTIFSNLSPHSSNVRFTFHPGDMAGLQAQVENPTAAPRRIQDPSFPKGGHEKPFSVARMNVEGIPSYLLAVFEGGQTYQRSLGVAREDLFINHGFILATGVLGLSWILALVFLSQLSRKFELLSSSATRIKEGEYSHRIPVSADEDEFDEVARALNGMARKIESTVDDMQRNEDARRSLLLNAAGDLSRPIENIKTITSSLHRKTSEGQPEAPPLESLQSSLTLLEHMLEELRELATLERVSAEASLESLPLQELFERIHSDFRSEATEKNIRLNVFIDADLPPVLGDKKLLPRLLANLLGNSLRYTPSGGEVSLSAARGERGILVRVSDTGVGISKEELPRLFERYYRGDHSRPQISGSTGLGLAIVKRIADIHHTGIFVESSLGVGSSFWFELLADEESKDIRLLSIAGLGKRA